MPGRSRTARSPRPTVPPRPDGLAGFAERYLESLLVKNYSARTVGTRRRNLGWFVSWCGDRGLMRPGEITRPIIERYQRWLFYLRTGDARKPLSPFSQYGRLETVKAFFKWLARNNHILSNPAGEIEMPRLGVKLPKEVLTAREAELILLQPAVETAVGIRDRAILETLYATGIRRTELTGLTIYQINADAGTLMVRRGKGDRDRVVPIGERALRWIDKYLLDVRPRFVVEPDRGFLFLTYAGEPFSPDGLTSLVRAYVRASEIGKKGACHLFRHTLATVMLENGADLRVIQQILGHASLETTQIYTHVSISHLKDVYRRTHPAAVFPTQASHPLNPESDPDPDKPTPPHSP
jgi:integrase/recombinase XerD